ncbi:MAG: PP2C family protein-serine/threonine phosphatase [Candidatus Pararuminococcus gallinarum]|jgi:serine/threonine protein phosphatase PrpC
MNIIAITRKGPSKAENEDRIVIGKNLLSEGNIQAAFSSGIVAVADGVGGNNAGAVASHFVAQTLTSIDEASQEVFAKINENLLQLSKTRADYSNMATTLSGISVSGSKTVLFSVGNTRVYLLQGRKYLKQITSDDTTLNYLFAAGQLTAENA